VAPAKKEEKPRRKPGKSRKKKAPQNKARGKSAAAAQFDQAKKAVEAAEAEKIAEKKALKARIKTLIDEHQIKDWQGETPYRYQVGKKLRELYVKPEMQKQLSSRELAITRLNGATYLVPLEIASQIRDINPLWTVFNTDQDSAEENESNSDDYGDYQVPDDLTW